MTVIVTSRAVLRIRPGSRSSSCRACPRPPTRRRCHAWSSSVFPARLRQPNAATFDQYEAVRLFIARASATWPAFVVNDQNAPAIAGITARLHGMPLAIELAAARVKLLSPEQYLQRLERQLGFLTSAARDLPDRQRTLRGAIGWSYELLDDDHRRLLGELSVFRGGWSLEAAEAVADAPGWTCPSTCSTASPISSIKASCGGATRSMTRSASRCSSRSVSSPLRCWWRRVIRSAPPRSTLPCSGHWPRTPHRISRVPGSGRGSTASSGTTTTSGRRSPGR